MKSSIPTLTIDGFVDNPKLKMSKIFEYFLLADYSQSSIFQGDVSSFKYIMATNSLDLEIVDAMESTLTRLFERYYDSASVDVRVETNPDTNTQYLKINVVVTNNGEKYYLYREIQYTNGRIDKMSDRVDELWSGLL